MKKKYFFIIQMFENEESKASYQGINTIEDMVKLMQTWEKIYEKKVKEGKK